MKTRFLVSLLVVPALLMAAALDGLPLERTAKAGDSHKYSQVFSIIEDGETIEITGEITSVIKKIDDEGNFEIEDSQKTLKMVASGEVIDMSDEEPTVVASKLSPTGEQIELSDFEDDPMAYRISNATSFRFPTKAVEKGGTWDYEYKADSKKKTIAAKATFTLEGPDVLHGHKCFKVNFVYKETEGNDPTTSKGSFWVREEDGLELKVTLDVKNLPLDEGASVDCTLTSNWVKP